MSVDVTVVVPCYNEAPLLARNAIEVRQVIEASGYTVEFIFVDDCSADTTRDIILQIESQWPNTRHIFNAENQGRGGTFMVGARQASGRYIGFLDIDLEVSAGYLPQVLAALDEGYEVATVDRHYELSGPPIFVIRGILSRGYKRMQRWILKLPYRDTETGYKFFKREALFGIMDRTKNRHWFWDTEIMAYAHLAGLRVKEVPGIFQKKRDKISTVRVIPDTYSYFRELLRFKRQMRRLS